MEGNRSYRAIHKGNAIYLPLSMRLGLLFIFLISSSSLAYDRSRAASHLHIGDLPALPLADYHRMLIVSPHPDDETLAAGGLIQIAIQDGIEVRVVILTNGDAQMLAPLAIEKQVKPRSADYVLMGERRQEEAQSALKELGLSKGNIYFLGYPDRGLDRLWTSNWGKDCPARALFTHATHSPYTTAYHLQASYCGSNLAADLYDILAAYRPDLILLPHPNDEHPDHRSAGNFATLAVDHLQELRPDYQPAVLGYLVHYGFFPQPRKIHLNDELLPPLPLSDEMNDWMRVDLTPDQERVKLDALKAYSSQMRLLGNFLPSFARMDEIFVPISVLKLSPLEYTNLPLPENGVKSQPLAEPTSESARRLFLGGTDLVGWEVTRLGDQLILTANTRGRLLPGLQYRILVKSPTGVTTIYNKNSAQVTLTSRSISVHIDLAEMGDPTFLGYEAEVREGVVLDRTGWSFASLRGWLP